MTVATLALVQQLVTEADENRVLLRVVAIGLTIFVLSIGALYAFFRSFEARENRTDFRSVVLLCVLIVVVVLGCFVLLRITMTSTKY